MYRCDDCGSTFEQPKIITEMHGFTWGPGEEIPFCPFCGSDCFDEVEEDE